MSTQPTVYVTTLNGLHKAIRLQTSEWGFTEDDHNRPWYRGHSSAGWSLQPSSLRKGTWNAKARENEAEAFEEFWTKAPALGAPDSIRSNCWDGYFLMQHFGAPTRLLDWSESVLVALYFAVSSSKEKEDCAVWMLDPYELNRRNSGFKRKEGYVASPGFLGDKPGEQKRMDQWLPWANRARSKVIPKEPIALYPSYFARRIESQRSGFTLHGSDRNGLTKSWRKGGPLLKIVVRRDKKAYFKSVVRDMGVDTASVYPDLHGLGKLLAEKWTSQ